MTAWLRWFAQPWALWLLLALPAFSLLWAWARWRRRQALRQLGTMFLVERLLLVRPRWRRLQSALLVAGVIALTVGIAGPRWGAAEQPELLVGKDIVVVLDMSKSMLAEQPSRFERARRSLRDLANGLEARGGHRVALVVFAAHAKLQFPLTGDYEHFRFVLEQLDPESIAPALRPQAGEKIASGTRIGAALSLAASVHAMDDRAGRQDIILLSDGDDPAGDDEWLQGVQLAHQRSIPVHVMAIGDPRAAHPIRTGANVVHYERTVVQSKLNEPLLQEVARRTGGIYFPAHLSSLPLGKLMRGHLESAPDADAANTALVQPAVHYGIFFLAALVLLGVSMLMSDGPRFVSTSKNESQGNGTVRKEPVSALDSTLRWTAVALLPLLMSAEPLASVEEAVRQGNAAFARRDYDLALQHYAQAAPATADPGLVAFNQGAALFRLGHFDEAAAQYQRCLEDQAIHPVRLARANYDLGTALLQAGEPDRPRLERAIAALRQCLALKPGADLERDATYNLELAKWLWIQAKPASISETPKTPEQPQDPTTQADRRSNGVSQSNAKGGNETNDGAPGKDGIDQPGLDSPRKKLAHGALQVLPDSDKLQPLTLDETTAHLDQLMARILRDRRQYWQQAAPPSPGVKDW